MSWFSATGNAQAAMQAALAAQQARAAQRSLGGGGGGYALSSSILSQQRVLPPNECFSHTWRACYDVERERASYERMVRVP